METKFPFKHKKRSPYLNSSSGWHTNIECLILQRINCIRWYNIKYVICSSIISEIFYDVNYFKMQKCKLHGSKSIRIPFVLVPLWTAFCKANVFLNVVSAKELSDFLQQQTTQKILTKHLSQGM